MYFSNSHWLLYRSIICLWLLLTLLNGNGPFFQDEEPETSWMLIQENDLVALFSQFPFDAIFKHLLKMDPNIPSKLDSGLLYIVWSNFYLSIF